jgi:hypothetical protein
MLVDFADILAQLWRRRAWMAAVLAISAVAGIASVYRITLTPPGLHSRSIERGAAEAQLLVDAPRTGVGDLVRDLDPLTARAQVVAQLMRSDPIVSRIAARMHIPPSAIEAQTDLSALNLPQSQLEPGQGKRAAQIAGESRLYRLTFQAVPDQPTVNIFAQSNTAGEARRLADSAIQATRDWLVGIQNAQQLPDRRRTVITQLGQADAGLVNSGASRLFAGLVFVGLFCIGCLAILLVNRAVMARAARKGDVAPLEPRRRKRAATAIATAEQRNGYAPAKAKAMATGGKPARRARRSS